MKKLLVLLLLTATLTATANATNTPFKISTSGNLTWKEKITCTTIQTCLTDRDEAIQRGFKASVTYGKKKKYVEVSYKYPLTEVNGNDIQAFMNSKSLAH